MTKPSMKLPRQEAAPIPRLARGVSWFLFGVAGVMLLLLLCLVYLAAKQGKPLSWIVVAGWLIIFVAWPARLGVREWQRYQQARHLEQGYTVQPGKILGFAHEEIGSLEATPNSHVYWIVFMVNDGAPIKQQISLESYQRLNVGDTIEVEVSLDNHNLCRAKVP
ncbi:MAG: hypothetical protein JW892_05590 [Anaerolineae bacterium]|nr:hypothetical protein [Anaerolineae bacterium]